MKQPVENYPLTNEHLENPGPHGNGAIDRLVELFNPPRGNTIPPDAATNRNQRFPSLPNPTIKTEASDE